MIRLEPMDDADFAAFRERAIPRRAAKWVERGIWTEDRALEACREFEARRLPQGRKTPGSHFLKVVEQESGISIGEVWYTAEEQGGKLQFWIEWILIEPDYRRKGHATEVLHMLEATAKDLGADRVGLTVWTDNPNALSLYSKLGYTPANVNMTKSLTTDR